MKYKLTVTAAAIGHVNSQEFFGARWAVITYNNIRAHYRRLGYTLADAGRGHNSRAELWVKKGRADRNIEIWPVCGSAAC